jgi:hypothetical protein
MKLRVRNNSLRLRLNRREVEGLAAGAALREQIHFPGNACLAYELDSSPASQPETTFTQGVIHISAPETMVSDWANSDEIGLYFDLPANGAALSIAIEKDLECIDGPVEERDPDAFPRASGQC